jgi:hypothetical protein
MKHFRTRNFLFMGYGLNDWNLRVVLNNLRGVLPGDPGAAAAAGDEEEMCSWAIQFCPSDLEVELWGARNVKIYNVDINEFVKQMREEST